MTATLDDVNEEDQAEATAEEQAAAEMVRRAREHRLSLSGTARLAILRPP